MHIKIPERKVKARLTRLVVLLSLFLATLIVCAVIFAVWITSGFHVLSPLSALTQSVGSDAQLISIQQVCQEEKIPCGNVAVVDDKTVQLTLDNHAVVLLSLKKDVKKQLSSLQQVISQLTIKGKQFKKLDFRFENVIVSF